MLKRPAMWLIRLYQRTISRVLPSSCRFYPTCSEYTYQAIERFGFFRGGWLGVKRISRCHPFNEGGYDPVPETLDGAHGIPLHVHHHAAHAEPHANHAKVHAEANAAPSGVNSPDKEQS